MSYGEPGTVTSFNHDNLFGMNLEILFTLNTLTLEY